MSVPKIEEITHAIDDCARNTAVSRKVIQQNRSRQCRKVLWVMGVSGP